MILITGGARSGKSTLAESIAKETGENIVYIATAIPFDDGMKDRIKRHRESRPRDWQTIEKYDDFQDIIENQNFINCDTVLLDCMTLMVSNLLLESGIDFEKCSYNDIDKIEKYIFNQINILLKVTREKKFIVVTNEVGMGLVPSYKLGSVFRDIAGRVNQHLAARSKEVYLTVSGIPIKIK